MRFFYKEWSQTQIYNIWSFIWSDTRFYVCVCVCVFHSVCSTQNHGDWRCGVSSILSLFSGQLLSFSRKRRVWDSKQEQKWVMDLVRGHPSPFDHYLPCLLGSQKVGMGEEVGNSWELLVPVSIINAYGSQMDSILMNDDDGDQPKVSFNQ